MSINGEDRTLNNNSFGSDNPRLLSDANSLQLGRVLGGRYQLLEVLGEGGMSAVFLSRHRELDQLVAIKVLRFDKTVGEDSLKRFLQEAKATFQLNHPNLIRLLDFSAAEEDLPYLVMEYVPGQTLAQVLKKKGRLEVKEFVQIFSQVCDGLAYAHSRGIIHRDLKPSNIMLATEPDGTNVAKIVDFGIAKIAHADKEQHLTKTGEIFGSPFYMSPEQCRGLNPDKRSDLYSIGCAMFECLSGEVPYRGENSMRTLFMHIDEPVPTLRIPKSKASGTARALDEIVGRLLQKEPENRFQSAGDLKRALLECANRPDRQVSEDASFRPPLPPLETKAEPFGALRKYGPIAAGVILASAGAIFAFANFRPSGENASGKPSDTLNTPIATKVPEPTNSIAASRVIPDKVAMSKEVTKSPDEVLKERIQKDDAQQNARPRSSMKDFKRQMAMITSKIPAAEDVKKQVKAQKAAPDKAKGIKQEQREKKVNFEKNQWDKAGGDLLPAPPVKHANPTAGDGGRVSKNSAQALLRLRDDIVQIEKLRKSHDDAHAEIICANAVRETSSVSMKDPLVLRVYFTYLSILAERSDKDREVLAKSIIDIAGSTEKLMTFDPKFPLLKQALVYGWHGQALMALQDYHEANNYFSRAIHCSVAAGPAGDVRVADWSAASARALFKMGKTGQALDLVDRVEFIARKKDPLTHFIILTAQASLLWEARQVVRARKAYKAASQIAGTLHFDNNDREFVRFLKVGKQLNGH